MQDPETKSSPFWSFFSSLVKFVYYFKRNLGPSGSLLTTLFKQWHRNFLSVLCSELTKQIAWNTRGTTSGSQIRQLMVEERVVWLEKVNAQWKLSKAIFDKDNPSGLLKYTARNTFCLNFFQTDTSSLHLLYLAV